LEALSDSSASPEEYTDILDTFIIDEFAERVLE
jgi:hypothetical protein